MKVALLLNDTGYTDMDFSRPDLGNPGIGGSEFDVIMLAFFLPLYIQEIELVVFHYRNNCLPVNCIDCLISSESDLLDSCAANHVDILIYNGGERSDNDSWYNKLKEKKQKSICWIHNHIYYEELERLNDSNEVKAVVFVSRQLYDRYIDHEVIAKSTYIFNMFNANNGSCGRKENYANWVTYTGSLIKTKGFHILASQWAKIVKAIPDAQLHVIGNGKLYNRGNALGPYGIADHQYERDFMKYLVDEDGEVLPSVFFHGVLGMEKADIYNNSAVGVVNPSGISETLGMSAIEMEAHGIPVVTRKSGGLCDAIADGKSGILITREKQLSDSIICLLRNKTKNQKMGEYGNSMVKEKFSPKKMSNLWEVCLKKACDNDMSYDYIRPNGYYFHEKKIIRMLIHSLRNVMPRVPSLYSISYHFRRSLCNGK